MPEVITTTTAAEVLGVSQPTLMKFVRSRDIPSTLVGRHTRLKRDDGFAFRRAHGFGSNAMRSTSSSSWRTNSATSEIRLTARDDLMSGRQSFHSAIRRIQPPIEHAVVASLVGQG